MADPGSDDKFDIEVIDRQEDEDGDYSFTFIMTPKAG
jgi:hypothetical protein